MNNPLGYADPSGYSAENPNSHDDPWTTVVYDGTIQHGSQAVAETRAEGVLDSVAVVPDQATGAVDNEKESAGRASVTNPVRIPIVGDDNFVIGWMEVDASSLASALAENSAYSAELEATQSASVLVPAIGVGGFAGSEAGASILSPSVLGLLVFALTCPGDSCVSKTENSTNEGALAYERVYRVWGGGSGPWGQSWTPVDPRLDIANYRNLAGLPNLNTGQFLSVGLLVNNDGLRLRSAVELDCNIGGWPEYLIPAPIAQVKLQCIYTLPPPLHMPYLE